MMTIKQYRLERGMTQAELAAAMGVQQTNVSRWERGAIRPLRGPDRRRAAARAEKGAGLRV